MSILLEDLISTLRYEISDLDSTPANQTFVDAGLETIIDEAAKEYSKKRPMSKLHTFSIISGTGTYDLPSDFLFELYVPLADRWKYEDRLQNTPQGLVPLSASWQAPTEFLIQGDQIEFSPEPTSNFDLEIKCAARHLLTSPGDIDTYVTLPAKDQELVILKAHAICMRRLATDSAKLFKYTKGDVTIDKSVRAKQYADRSRDLNEEWDNRMETAVGVRG